MAIDRDQKYRQMAVRSKYQRLYTHLCGLADEEWKASFAEIETIIGFKLPASARLHKPWWANQKGGGGHSQALAWTMAGWETAEIDLDTETLVLRKRSLDSDRPVSLGAVWPARSVGKWPEGVSISREDLYAARL